LLSDFQFPLRLPAKIHIVILQPANDFDLEHVILSVSEDSPHISLF